MIFDLRAAKAYVGGAIAAAGPVVSGAIIGVFEAGTHLDIPANIEGYILAGVSYALGYVGVYFTRNASA